MEKRRVQWKGLVGEILSEGKDEYYVKFPAACQFVQKSDCALVYGLKRETKEA